VQVKILTGASSLKKTYIIGEQIGEGNFGKVYEAKLTADSSCQVAIKVLDKKFMDADEIKSLHYEIQIMEMIDHPNIVKYLEAYDDKRFLYIVMQKCEQGCLFDSRQTNLKEGKTFTE
jgi:serine/threonine protein kinase